MSIQSPTELGINSDKPPAKESTWTVVKRSWLFCFVASVFIGIPVTDYLSAVYTPLPAQQALLLAFEARNEKGRFVKLDSDEKATLSFRMVREQTVDRLNNLADAVDNSLPGNLLGRVFLKSARQEEVAKELRKIARKLDDLEEGNLGVNTFHIVADDVKKIFHLAHGTNLARCHFSAGFEQQLRQSLSISIQQLAHSVDDFELTLDKAHSTVDLLLVAAESCEDSRDVFLGLGFIMFSDTYSNNQLSSEALDEILSRQNTLVNCMERFHVRLLDAKESDAANKIAGYLSSNRTRAAVITQLKAGNFQAAVQTVATAD